MIHQKHKLISFSKKYTVQYGTGMVPVHNQKKNQRKIEKSNNTKRHVLYGTMYDPPET